MRYYFTIHSLPILGNHHQLRENTYSPVNLQINVISSVSEQYLTRRPAVTGA